MLKFREYAAVCAIGSIGYSMIEIIWRGFTHWTMAVAGGAGFLLLYLTELKMAGRALAHRCAVGCALLTSVELAAGCIVNRVLHMNVWDYSGFRGNLLGQVCPLYSMLWFLLCIPVMPLSHAVQRRLCRSGAVSRAIV